MSLFDAGSFPVLLVAALAASNCALVGSYLVLRRTALLGDAIGHGVLPGLVVGFILAGNRDLAPMLAGALAAAFATAFLTDLLRRHLRIDGDAAMGVVFTTMFAGGVLLIQRYAAQVDLDPGCVLYGQVEYAALDRSAWAILGWTPPRAAVSLAAVLVIDLSLVALLWKELLLSSFDPALGSSIGVRAEPMHLLLMGMTAMTTVASFEAVGSILVVAMLVIPGAIGHLFADRLLRVLLFAQGAAALSALLGLAGAERLDTSVAGMVAVAAGGLFAVAWLLAPRHGWLPQRLRRFALSLRIAEEDRLAELYRLAERAEGISPASAAALVPARHPAWLRSLAGLRLRLSGATGRADGGVALTRRGRVRGRRVVRRHRLWEIYLRERLALPASHLHEPAHRIEHFLDEELAARLEERLERPERDPHGREIPGERGGTGDSRSGS